MSRQLYRIENALFNQVWCIMPTVHNAMVKQLQSHYAKDVRADLFDDSGELDDDKSLSIDVPSNVALIQIDGVIGKHLSLLETQCGGVDVDAIASQLNIAAADTNIESICLYFNTPGGSVTGVSELAQLIAEIRETKDVIGYADCLCASVGMWLASQCTAFYCAPSAQIGCVGVYCLLLDESVALSNEGIKVNAISAGTYKLSGASFKPLTDDERAMFQADVNKTYAAFKSAILSNRDVADSDMQGQVFDGDTAVAKGFCDGTLNSLQDAANIFNN
jgi:capsid assembly protease